MEIDKRLIDALREPLLHLIRNSADHGIESPQIRAALDKSREGTITLEAIQSGRSIVIKVSDDGRGLDRQRILSEAIENQILAPSEAARMTDDQVWNLLWRPGFSTAQQVTEVSGRGMGLDIVRTKVESLGGCVTIESRPGEGCSFTITLPLRRRKNRVGLARQLFFHLGLDRFFDSAAKHRGRQRQLPLHMGQVVFYRHLPLHSKAHHLQGKIKHVIVPIPLNVAGHVFVFRSQTVHQPFELATAVSRSSGCDTCVEKTGHNLNPLV